MMSSENPVEIVDLSENVGLQEQPVPETLTASHDGTKVADDSVEGSVEQPVVESGISVDMEAELEECTTGEPSLLPAYSEYSDFPRSMSMSGRVTPASQSDVGSLSSSEKSTPTRKRRSTDQAGRQIEFDNVSTSSGSIKLTKFPNRIGIRWKKGEKLEAMDFMQKWFPAKIIDINDDDMEVLIHFDGWNRRYDEWLPMTSERIRPLTRHSARKGDNRKVKADFKIGDRVLAKWTDCKMYEAKVTGIMPTGAVEVIFYDGFKKIVQPINLRPMPSKPLETKTTPETQKKSKPKPPETQPSDIESYEKTTNPTNSATNLIVMSPLPGGVMSPLPGGVMSPLPGGVMSPLPGDVNLKSEEVGLAQPQGLVQPQPEVKPRRHICPECNKAFKQKHHLREHMRIHSAVGPDGLSTRDGQKPSPVVGVQPDLQSRDPRHRKKMLVSSTMFTSPSASMMTSLPEGASSVPEVELPRAPSPVVNLEPMAAEIDFALQQMETETVVGTMDQMVPTQAEPVPGTSTQTSQELYIPTTDSFIAAAYAMPMPKKAFVIESDHNQYKCPHENCGKGFRKESLLDYHIKYYHIQGETPPPPAPAKKRRVTTSSTDPAKTSSHAKKAPVRKQRHVSEGGTRPSKRQRQSVETVEPTAVKQEVKEEVVPEVVPITDVAEEVLLETGVKQEDLKEESAEIKTEEQDLDKLASPASPDVTYEEEVATTSTSEDNKQEVTLRELRSEIRKRRMMAAGAKHKKTSEGQEEASAECRRRRSEYQEHRRSESQDTTVTEDSEAEDYLKPDELVNCICGYYEENGLMIQCEVCMCWQHASCFGITDRTLPKVYVCYVCENPPGIRESSRYIHEQDWFKNGELASFGFLNTPPPSEERKGAVKATHSLVADLNQLNTVLHSLKLQLKILRTKDEKKLKQWHLDWDMVESLDESSETNQSAETAEVDPSETKEDNSNDQSKGDNSVIGERKSPVVESETTETKATDDFNSDEGGKTEQKNKESLPNGPERPTDEFDQNEVEKDTEPMQESGTSAVNGTASMNGEAGPSTVPDIPEPVMRTRIDGPLFPVPSMTSVLTDEDPNYSDSTESALQDDDPIETCERNLVQHILRIQGEISRRMDMIEEQINALEGLELPFIGPPGQGLEPDLTQLKKNMKSVDSDLSKVKRMAVFH